MTFILRCWSSYWSLDQSSSALVAFDNIHPTIYGCLLSMPFILWCMSSYWSLDQSASSVVAIDDMHPTSYVILFVCRPILIGRFLPPLMGQQRYLVSIEREFSSEKEPVAVGLVCKKRKASCEAYLSSPSYSSECDRYTQHSSAWIWQIHTTQQRVNVTDTHNTDVVVLMSIRMDRFRLKVFEVHVVW